MAATPVPNKSSEDGSGTAVVVVNVAVNDSSVLVNSPLSVDLDPNVSWT